MSRKTKWGAMAIAIIAFILLGSAIESTTLTNRALVVGLAIDKIGEELEVTAQILVAKSDRDPSSNNTVISAKGTSISGALNVVSQQTSMLVALSHCNLIILSREIIEENAYNILDYLIRNSYLSENALIVTSEGKAKDILNTKVAFSEMTSFYAQRTITSYGNYKGISKKTVKDFLVNFHTHGKSNWLTIIKPIDIKAPPDTTVASGAEGGKEEQQFIFDLTSSAIIKGNKYVVTTDEEGTSGINFFRNTIDRGAISLIGDNKESIELYIIKKNNKTKYDLDTKKVIIEIDMLVVLKEVIDFRGLDMPIDKVELTDTEKARIQDKVKKEIEDVFLLAQENDVDIFDLYGAFYRRYGKKWKTVAKEDYLNDITLEATCKIRFK